MKTWQTILMCLGVALIFAMPYFLTRDWSGISFQETGPIGDTIGGLTAPFIGLASGILIYLSFRAQIKANRLIMHQIEIQQMYSMAEKIEADIVTVSKASAYLIENNKTWKSEWPEISREQFVMIGLAVKRMQFYIEAVYELSESEIDDEAFEKSIDRLIHTADLVMSYQIEQIGEIVAISQKSKKKFASELAKSYKELLNSFSKISDEINKEDK